MKYRMKVQLGKDLVRVRKKRCYSCLLKWLLGSSQEIVLLIPEKTIESIEIHEEDESLGDDEKVTSY